MLVNGYLYTKELDILDKKCWYNPHYKFYYNRSLHYENGWNKDDSRRELVSIDSDGNILGYITYYFDIETRNAQSFGIINFTGKPSYTFTKDVLGCIHQLFTEYNCHGMTWMVTRGNPAEQLYDRFVFEHGGRVVGEYIDDVCIHGTYYNTKTYQIMQDEYLTSIKGE